MRPTIPKILLLTLIAQLTFSQLIIGEGASSVTTLPNCSPSSCSVCMRVNTTDEKGYCKTCIRSGISGETGTTTTCSGSPKVDGCLKTQVNAQNEEICLACDNKNGYYLSSGTDAQATECTKCDLSTSFFADRKCTKRSDVSGPDVCKLASSNSDVCIGCKDPESIVVGGKCVKLPNCLSSTNEKSCTTCRPGYFGQVVDSNTKCIPCGNLNTLTCESATRALTCRPGYFLKFVENLNSTTCHACPENSKSCTADITKTVCIDGYFFDQTAKKCKECGVNIKKCSLQNIPTECADGFYLRTTDNTCRQTIDNCDQATNSQNCIKCASGFYSRTSATQCMKMPDNCAEASGTAMNCVRCNKGFLLTSPTQCVALNAGCTNPSASSSTGSETSCSSCETGYYLNEGNCVACLAGAATCTSNVSLTCKNSTDLLINGLCVTRDVNCVEASASACTKCADGFYKNPNFPNTCTACATGVKTCALNAADSSLTCFPGYNFVEKTNPKNGGMGNCVNCDSSAANVATECVASDPTKPAKCQDGYRVNGTVGTATDCQACGANIKTCDAAAATATACNDGYFLDGTSCTICSTAPTRAKKCNSATDHTECVISSDLIISGACTALNPLCTGANSGKTDCTGCNDGYYLSGVNTCTACGARAKTCESNTKATTCTEASDFIINDVCTERTSDCAEPAATQAGASACTKCSPGFYLENSNKCTSCGSNASECVKSGDVWEVKACADGFYFSEKACFACADNTKTCTSPTVALTCNDGYYLSNGKCNALPTGCKVSPKGGATCDECLTGYHNTNILSSCQGLASGCIAGDDKGVCTTCDAGFKLDSNKQCQKEVAGCKNFNTAIGICEECDFENDWFATGVSVADGGSDISMDCQKKTSGTLFRISFAVILAVLALVF